MATARTLHSLLGTFALLAAAPSWALAPDQLFQQVSPSVWQVGTVDTQGKPIATGSAVVIAPQTLVTNCHVLKGAARVVVRQRDRTHAARLQHADTERDLCQITAAGLQAPAVAIAPQPAHVGQRIYTIGAPRGLELTLSDGLVSGLREEGISGGLVQISAPISPGSSGGGLFDDEGRLLGITSSGIVGVAQNLNFARPASLIAEIPARSAAALQKWREARAPATSTSTTSTSTAASVQPVPSQPAGDIAAKPGSPPAAAVPVARTTMPPAAPPLPGHIASGYAAIDDVDAVPYLSERGRKVYQEWLKYPLPRAFAIAPNGYFWQTATTRPKEPDMPVDPSERALLGCERAAKRPCKLYAVNNSVVWVKEPSPLARDLDPGMQRAPAATQP